MYNLSKKQKIVIGIILCIISIAILFYIYTKDNTAIILAEETIGENQILENQTQESTIEEETKKDEDESKIIVHVSGAVNKEGIVELEENSRISDAINKAEGLKENADTKNINLAFKLEDGMKIYIPTIGEEKIETAENTGENTTDKTSKYITSSSGGVEQSSNEKENNKESVTEKVNINTASQTELETLPGIGPSTALKIINYREENGKFNSIEDIKEVSGIGDAKYENIKELICVK